ncbi:MAG: hypothetical protein IT431_14000 [Phycisphaerales bacterium]|nr:hypothetical protein [Phycisphaerales bacterium]
MRRFSLPSLLPSLLPARLPALLPAVLLSLAGGAACAQPAPSLDLTPAEAAEALEAMAPTNAALVYYQLFMQEDTDLNIASQAFEFEPVDPQHLSMSVEDSAKKLADSQDRIERFIWTARLPECDFGLRYQDGWALLLPHLGKMRNMARVLRADAVRMGGLGECDKAADCVDGMFGLAEHVRRDRVLISSLVSAAIARLAIDSAVHLAEHGQLTAEGRDMLIARIEALRADDYFGLLDCMTMEYTVSAGWAAMMPPDARAGEWLASSMGEGFEQPEVAARLDSMSREALFADMGKMAGYYRGVQQVWDDPQAIEKVQGLGALVEVGAFGETGRVFLASMGNVKTSELAILSAVDEALPKLIAYRPPEPSEKPAGAPTPATPASDRE